MAAFIQKLFKSRKTREETPTTASEPRTNEAEKEEARASRRATQLEALKGTPSQAELAELAISGITADVRLQAAEQLTDGDCLSQVQKQAKGRDKGVYQSVKQSLQKLKQEQVRREATTEAISALISAADEQARSEDTKLYEARLDTLLQKWGELKSHATEQQTQDFLAASHRCKERVEQLKAAREESARHEEQIRQREETLALLSATLEDLRAQPPETLPSLASLDALQKTQENRWLEATRDTSVNKREQKTYESTMLALRTYITAVRQIGQVREQLNELTEADANQAISDEQRQLAKTLNQDIQWPEGFPMPTLLAPVHRIAGQDKPAPAAKPEDQAKQKALAAELEQTLADLDAALDAKQLKESRQLFKTAQQQLKSLDHRHGKPFQARMQLLTGQLREFSV